MGVLLLELLIFSRNYFKTKANFATYPPVLEQLVSSATQASGYYRLYCTTGCLRDLSQTGKGATTGYNPIYLKNYFYFIQRAGGYRFGSYSLTLPPYQTYVDMPQPEARDLGYVGVRYVISPYELKDPGFSYLAQNSGYYLYKNSLEQPRLQLIENHASQPLSARKDLPGLIEIPLEDKQGNVVISEIYTPLWNAYDEHKRQLPVREIYDGLILIKVNRSVKLLTISFTPLWLRTFIWLSLATSGIVFFLGVRLLFSTLSGKAKRK